MVNRHSAAVEWPVGTGHWALQYVQSSKKQVDGRLHQIIICGKKTKEREREGYLIIGQVESTLD